MLCLCVAAGTYAADCKCDNEHHCDGVRLYDNNARRCTAFHKSKSTTRIRVSSKYIFYVYFCKNFCYKYSFFILSVFVNV